MRRYTSCLWNSLSLMVHITVDGIMILNYCTLVNIWHNDEHNASVLCLFFSIEFPIWKVSVSMYETMWKNNSGKELSSHWRIWEECKGRPLCQNLHYSMYPKDGEATVFTGVCVSTGRIHHGLWSQVPQPCHWSCPWGVPQPRTGGYSLARIGVSPTQDRVYLSPWPGQGYWHITKKVMRCVQHASCVHAVGLSCFHAVFGKRLVK